MKAFLDFISGCWKLIVTVVGAIAIVVTVISFSSQIATSADIKRMESQTAASIEQVEKRAEGRQIQFKKSMDLDRDISRLYQIQDNITRQKQLIKQYPKDKELVEDYEQLKKEKAILQERIDKR
jgi:hypothetical protein